MSLTAKVRRRLGRELRNSSPLKEVGSRLSASEKRIAAEHERLDRQIARIDRHMERAEAQAKRLDRLAQTMSTVQERLKPTEEITRLRDLDHERMTSQVRALEERVGKLEEQLADGTVVADTESTQRSISLLDEVRREHEQIRVRMQVITWYEERLRRVESSLLALYDGDPRHPV